MGIAPNLRGFGDIGAGWKMVIMDALDQEYKHFDEDILPTDTRELIEKRLVELHQAGFVHGDVRDANIIVRKDNNSGFMVIDFDWSGVIDRSSVRRAILSIFKIHINIKMEIGSVT